MNLGQFGQSGAVDFPEGGAWESGEILPCCEAFGAWLDLVESGEVNFGAIVKEGEGVFIAGMREMNDRDFALDEGAPCFFEGVEVDEFAEDFDVAVGASEDFETGRGELTEVLGDEPTVDFGVVGAEAVGRAVDFGGEESAAAEGNASVDDFGLPSGDEGKSVAGGDLR